MHDLLLADHAATSHSSADASYPCPKLQSTQYTYGQQTPNSRSSNPTCGAFNISPRPFKPSSYTPARSSLMIATLSHQVQPRPNSSLLTSMPTSFLTPQPLRAKLPTQWLRNLLLNKNDNLDDKIGFDNGILVAYCMCPPCELLVPRHKLSLIRSSSDKPTYFMQCPSNKTWDFVDA